jgi:3-phosphoshikimate 1-carboxyvinyltransferase
MIQKSQSAIVYPAESLGGTLEVQGDKSISHRVAMLSALASGTSMVKHFLQSEDCVNTLRAMEALGARTFFSEDGDLTIQGTSGKIMEPVAPLDLGNSGTGMRLLAGLIAGIPITADLTGDASLCSRPMNRIKEPLELMGAKVELLGENGCAPIRVHGGNLKGIEYAVPVASAQVKSCILLAALFAEGKTTVIETMSTRDHTERILQTLGVPMVIDGLKIHIEGYGSKGPLFKAREWYIPGDFSSAAYAMMAVAAREGATVTVKNVGLNSRRTAFLDVLKRMGARVNVIVKSVADESEQYGDVSIIGSELKGTIVGGAEIPKLIDEIPLVAIAGALAHGKTIISDARELRVKESDRISCMATNLQALGVDVVEMEDGMQISGPANLEAASAVQSHGDHRIAMSMAVLALYGKDPVCVNHIACIGTSYPAFWDDLKRLGAHVE